MPTEEQVRESLNEVIVPGAMRSLVELNLVRHITISDAKVEIGIASAALAKDTQELLKTKVPDAIGRLSEVKTVETVFVDLKVGIVISRRTKCFRHVAVPIKYAHGLHTRSRELLCFAPRLFRREWLRRLPPQVTDGRLREGHTAKYRDGGVFVQFANEQLSVN